MTIVTAAEVRALLLETFAGPLEARGLDPASVPDQFDLLTEGIIDSLGVIEMATAIDKRFGFQVDFEDMDAEQLTMLGPVCRYVEQKSRERARGDV